MKSVVFEAHTRRYQKPEVYVFSPGRANIIGEHTDYNQGWVLPFAIEQGIHIYVSKNNLGMMRINALDLQRNLEIPIKNLATTSEGWQRYIINAYLRLDLDSKSGIDLTFGGNLPIGSGVSSSSALTCGVLAGLNTLFQLTIPTNDLISKASEAENGIGLQGGIMDQTAIFKGKKNHALLIDCQDYSIQNIPLPETGLFWYLFDSGQKHNLVETQYNARRASCEKAFYTIQEGKSSIVSMRDISIDDVQTFLKDSMLQKRLTHVVEENSRVLNAVRALKQHDYTYVGSLLNESHTSLSSLYDVSTSEIDYLVNESKQLQGWLGGRIMGGGFGGCTINLFQEPLLESELIALKRKYIDKTGLLLNEIQIKPSEGIQTERIL